MRMLGDPESGGPAAVGGSRRRAPAFSEGSGAADAPRRRAPVLTSWELGIRSSFSAFWRSGSWSRLLHARSSRIRLCPGSLCHGVVPASSCSVVISSTDGRRAAAARLPSVGAGSPSSRRHLAFGPNPITGRAEG